jgi:glycosyltransferase involved in cell wall biosynthesis
MKTQPGILFFCATYLKPEMLHVHRQITRLSGWDVHAVTQRVENREQFPLPSLHMIPRSPWRWIGRLKERHWHAGPWQADRREVDAVLDVVRAAKVDVMHIFFGNVAVHWLDLLRQIDIPVVVSFHGADVTGAIAEPRYQAARDEVFARASRIACRSDALAERVITMGAPRDKTVVTRTVVPVPDGFVRSAEASASNAILQASRLVPKKGLKTTLHAFAKMDAVRPGAQLTLAGEGPMEQELRELASQLGVVDRVRFAGFLNQQQLAEEFEKSAVFVHPSESINGDTEGVPNSLLEAMAAGIPVVATRHGGIVEAVMDGETGFLVDESDADALADRIGLLLSDPSLNLKMGEAAQESVRRSYSESASAVALDRLYRSLIPSGFPTD